MTKYWKKQNKEIEKKLKRQKLKQLLQWSYMETKEQPQEWIRQLLEEAQILTKNRQKKT